MRVLVTRPSDQAARTAKRLAALGHRPFCAPALEIVPIAAPAPEGPFDLIVAASAQAFSGLAPEAALRAAPLFCVGEKTAEAGRALGFRVAFVAPRAEALAARLAEEKDARVRALPRGTRAQGLAGRQPARSGLASDHRGNL